MFRHRRRPLAVAAHHFLLLSLVHHHLRILSTQYMSMCNAIKSILLCACARVVKLKLNPFLSALAVTTLTPHHWPNTQHHCSMLNCILVVYYVCRMWRARVWLHLLSLLIVFFFLPVVGLFCFLFPSIYIYFGTSNLALPPPPFVPCRARWTYCEITKLTILFLHMNTMPCHKLDKLWKTKLKSMLHAIHSISLIIRSRKIW